MKAGIEIADGLDARRGVEATRLVPIGAVQAVADWPLASDGEAAGIQQEVMAALSKALGACGHVAFRHDGPLAGAITAEAMPPRSAADRLLEIAGLGPDRFGLVVASDPAVIAGLFAYGGWTVAAQAALVFDPAAPVEPILAALREGLDWRSRRLPHGARLLFGPGHDGDFAVIAAADAAWLDRFKSALR